MGRLAKMCQDKSAPMFPDSSVNRCLDVLKKRSAKPFLEKFVRMFPDSNATMYLDKNAEACPSNNAETFPDSSVRQYQGSSASMCLDNNAEMFPVSSAVPYLTRNVPQCQDNSARMFPASSARTCLDNSVNRFQDSSAQPPSPPMENKSSLTFHSSYHGYLQQKYVYLHSLSNFVLIYFFLLSKHCSPLCNEEAYF